MIRVQDLSDDPVETVDVQWARYTAGPMPPDPATQILGWLLMGLCVLAIAVIGACIGYWLIGGGS